MFKRTYWTPGRIAAAIGLTALSILAIAAAIWIYIQLSQSVIVSAPRSGLNDVTFEDQPSMVLAGDRDGNGRILRIPSGKQVQVECVADDEVLVLSIPPGGDGGAGFILCTVVAPTSTPSPTGDPASSNSRVRHCPDASTMLDVGQ